MGEFENLCGYRKSDADMWVLEFIMGISIYGYLKIYADIGKNICGY